MFTGLIEALGRLSGKAERGQALRITLEGPWTDLELGESISVNGVCLTAGQRQGGRFEVDVSRETLRASTLGALTVGAEVNLERSLAVGQRLGGHLVTGHVDAVVHALRVSPLGQFSELEIELPQPVSSLVAAKGSVALDGVSLTVNSVSETSFSVMLIPHTARVTSLGRVRQGTALNLEVDILARYVQRQLAAVGPRPGPEDRDQSMLDLLARAGLTTS